jgi:hypothetical protein
VQLGTPGMSERAMVPIVGVQGHFEETWVVVSGNFLACLGLQRQNLKRTSSHGSVSLWPD